MTAPPAVWSPSRPVGLLSEPRVAALGAALPSARPGALTGSCSLPGRWMVELNGALLLYPFGGWFKEFFVFLFFKRLLRQPEGDTNEPATATPPGTWHASPPGPPKGSSSRLAPNAPDREQLAPAACERPGRSGWQRLFHTPNGRGRAPSSRLSAATLLSLAEVPGRLAPVRCT